MPELGIGQITFLMDTLKKQEGLEMFDWNNRDMLWKAFENITVDEKRRLHLLMITGKIKDLISMLDQLGVERAKQDV
jgi:hypothetical protein